MVVKFGTVKPGAYVRWAKHRSSKCHCIFRVRGSFLPEMASTCVEVSPECDVYRTRKIPGVDPNGRGHVVGADYFFASESEVEVLGLSSALERLET